MKLNSVERIFPFRNKERVTGISTPVKGTFVLAIALLIFFLVFGATKRPLTAELDFMAKLGVTRIKEKVDAPGFTLPDLSGVKRSLTDFKGKFVMLNFWATW